MEPHCKYCQRVADVISDEFAQQGLRVSDLPDRVQEALKNIERRIASDLESMYQRINLPVGGLKKG